MDFRQTRPQGKRPKMALAATTGSSSSPECISTTQTPIFTIKRKPVPGPPRRNQTSESGMSSKTSEVPASAKSQSSTLPSYSTAWKWPVPEISLPTHQTYGGPGMRAELPSSKRPHPVLIRRQDRPNFQQQVLDTHEYALSLKQVSNDHIHATDRASELLDDQKRASLVSSAGSLTKHQRHDSAMESETEGECQKETQEWWIFE